MLPDAKTGARLVALADRTITKAQRCGGAAVGNVATTTSGRSLRMRLRTPSRGAEAGRSASVAPPFKDLGLLGTDALGVCHLGHDESEIRDALRVLVDDRLHVGHLPVLEGDTRRATEHDCGDKRDHSKHPAYLDRHPRIVPEARS